MINIIKISIPFDNVSNISCFSLNRINIIDFFLDLYAEKLWFLFILFNIYNWSFSFLQQWLIFILIPISLSLPESFKQNFNNSLVAHWFLVLFHILNWCICFNFLDFNSGLFLFNFFNLLGKLNWLIIRLIFVVNWIVNWLHFENWTFNFICLDFIIFLNPIVIKEILKL